MRMSHAMLKTQKHVTAEAELPSHRSAAGGPGTPRASGIYSLTPLAVRAIRTIEPIVREEMERIGGQELLLPIVHRPNCGGSRDATTLSAATSRGSTIATSTRWCSR